MTVLLFDIDGTLVRTNGAGKAAMEGALRDAFGVENILDVVPYSGRTDPAIGHDLLRVHGLPVTPENLQRLTSEYLQRLPAALDQFGGIVLPGVRELIGELRRRDDVRLGLLTGNVIAGATIKLSFFGLWSSFGFGGFGDGRVHRDDVAREALIQAKQRGPVALDRCWVIGDSPHDVSCTRSIGAKALAVATGWHSLDDLAKCDPDHAIPNLSDTDALLKLMV
jgi:phosphoglycolate phosphatase-like HAD superfamily hydrolase